MDSRTNRAFVARLAGSAIFDPNGDQVGKIRDVVVMIRSNSRPTVNGFVVEVPPHRRIFIPMTRITGLDAGQAVATGSVNLRSFQTKNAETLAMAELLDRKVTLIESGKEVTILDIGIDQTRNRNWEISKLFVRKNIRTGFRRRGETLMVNWDEVSGIGGTKSEQSAEALVESLEETHPADIADLLRTLPDKRKLEIARELDDERLADVLEELGDTDQVKILAMLDIERAADVVDAMDPADAADLLKEIPLAEAEEILSRIEPTDAEGLRRLQTYDDKSAGGMMTPEPVIVPPDTTVAEALAKIRNAEIPTSLAAQVLVVRPPLETPTGSFLGVVHFQRLLREPPATLVSSIIDGDLETVSPSAGLGEVVRCFATYNLVGLPVVDETNHLLGVVTVDDVVDHMLPEDWRETPANRVDEILPTQDEPDEHNETAENDERTDGKG